jgi:hypothetical protein
MAVGVLISASVDFEERDHVHPIDFDVSLWIDRPRPGSRPLTGNHQPYG